jgi:hypothetical protein
MLQLLLPCSVRLVQAALGAKVGQFHQQVAVLAVGVLVLMLWL